MAGAGEADGGMAKVEGGKEEGGERGPEEVDEGGIGCAASR